MILGIGIDIVKVSRIKESLTRYEYTFIEKILSEKEINILEEKYNYNRNIFDYDDRMITKLSNHVAKRFAAKEAFAKAMGVGFGKYIAFTEISVTNDMLGKPEIIVEGTTLQYLQSKIQELMINGDKEIGYNIHLSLSDDTDYAVANVVIDVNL